MKTQPREVGTELYTLAAASNAELPEMASVACMTNDLEFRRWITLYDELEKGVQETRRQAPSVDPLLEEQRRLENAYAKQNRSSRRYRSCRLNWRSATARSRNFTCCTKRNSAFSRPI